MSINAVRKRHGITKAIQYAACRALQRFVLLDITHVMIQDAQETKSPACELDVECRFLTAGEMREFSSDPANDIDPELPERLGHGYDFCFAGLVDGRLASYCWLALHSIEARHNRSAESIASGIAFSYPKSYAFRYKGFTHPDYRGNRIYQKIGSEASIAMRELGVRFLISTAEVVNFGAIKSSYRCGYKKFGTAVLIGVGDHVYVHSPDLSNRGILIGRDANVLDRNVIPTHLGHPIHVCI